jgi:hypothetical protein
MESLNVSFSSGVVFAWLVIQLIFGRPATGLATFSLIGWVFFIQNVMDWADWGLECNKYGRLQVWGILFRAFLFGSSCLIAF